jgi:hypothetical protein
MVAKTLWSFFTFFEQLMLITFEPADKRIAPSSPVDRE